MSNIVIINDILTSRFNDVILSYKQNNALVYVPMQSYLEVLLKTIIKKHNKLDYLAKRDTLGDLLCYKFLISILKDDYKYDNIELLKQINSFGNDYKHNALLTFNNDKARNFILELYRLTVQFYNVTNSKNLSTALDEKILIEDNKQSTIEDVKETTISIIKEEKEKLQTKQQQIEVQIKKIKDEIAQTVKEKIKISTTADPGQISALISMKENEIADLEIQLSENPNNKDKLKEVQLLEHQIARLRIQEKEALSGESFDSAKTRLSIQLQDTEERLEQVIADKAPLEKATKEIQTKPIETINDISANFFVSFDQSYVDCLPFTIINIINREYCKSIYEPYYAVIYNQMIKGPRITITPYLQKLNLNVVHITEIFKLEILLLSLIRNGKLNDTEWNINIINRSIKLLKIAINNIVFKVRRLLTLSNIEYLIPKFNVTDEEAKKDYINISFDVYYSGFKNMFVIMNNLFSEDNYCKIWIAPRIKYSIDNSPKHLTVLQELNYELFGFSTFRTGQIEILTNALNGNKTIGILTTGGGKSLIYQFVGLMQPKITIVVDPINALVFDQVRKLTTEFNVTRIEKIISGQESTPIETIERMKNNPPLFAFASPERFQNKEFRDLLIALNARESIGLITLDEVHCLSEWGHDFRVSYLMLVSTINQFCRGVQYLGLTATAAINVIKDLQVELGIANPEHIIYSKKLQRDNLDFQIIKLNNRIEFENAFDEMLEEDVFLDESFNFTVEDNSNGYIVFCKTVSDVERFYRIYSAKYKDKVSMFHGNFREHFESFVTNKSSLMFTTKAFGMGIDKPNIRKTVHYGMPSSRENYFQEAGRGGRDNLPTQCVLMTHETDLTVAKLESEFLNLNTTYERLFDIQGHLKSKYSDISTNAYFLVNGIRTIETEIKSVIDIYDNLKKYENLVGTIMTSKERYSEVEQYLYVLHKIGIIRNWEVKYQRNSIQLTIYLHPLHDDFDHIKSVSYNYISQYPSSRNELEQLQHLTSIKEFDQLIKIVRTWYHKTFIRSKREQLANMVEFIKRLSGANRNNDIQNELSQFFDISKLLESNSSNGSLRLERTSIKDTIKRVKNMKEDQLENTRITMERLLETEESNSINLFTSLINLRLNDFDSRNGRERFRYTVKQMNDEEIESMFDNIDSLYKDLSPNQQKLILNELYVFDKERLIESNLLDIPSEATEEMTILLINNIHSDLFKV